MKYFYNKQLTIRIILTLVFFMLLVYSINIGLDVLRPNSLVVVYSEETEDYRAEVAIDTGRGFGRNIVSEGEAYFDFVGSVESLRITFEAADSTEDSVGVKKIKLLRYAGRFDFYFPLAAKTWTGEGILEDYSIQGETGQYWVEDDILYLRPELTLEYQGDFSRTYQEIDQRLGSYRLYSNLAALFLTVGFYFLTGYAWYNRIRINQFLERKGLAPSLNTKLLFGMFFGIIMAILPPLYALKLPFIFAAAGCGSAILLINRERIIAEDKKEIYRSKLIIVLLVLAILVGVFTFSFRLGEHDFREDEFQVTNAAAGYYHEGDYYRWNWLEGEAEEEIYERAFLHTYMVAQAYRIFGISEWSSRLVSVTFGVLFLPLLFFTVRYFLGNSYLALLTVYVAVFYDQYIIIFRYARMYALLLPLFLVIVYLVYRALNDKCRILKPDHSLYSLLYSYLNFNYYYAIAALALIYLTYLIHINTLVIMPAALIYVLIIYFITRDKRYICLASCGVFVLGFYIAASSFGLVPNFSHFLSFFDRRNYSYLEYFTQHPFPWEAGTVFLILGLVATFLLKGEKQKKYIYLYAIIGFSMFFFIFIADRYDHFLYSSHLTPISIALILFGLFMLIKAMNSRILTYLFAGLLILFMGINYYQNYDRHYADGHSYGNYSSAYQTIVDNIDPEKEAIYGQFLRTYYLQDLEGTNVATVDMLNHRRYSFESFVTDLERHEAGWITWETRKERHLQPEIINFIEGRFDKHHGQGIDNSKIEVFYYEQSDLQ